MDDLRCEGNRSSGKTRVAYKVNAKNFSKAAITIKPEAILPWMALLLECIQAARLLQSFVQVLSGGQACCCKLCIVRYALDTMSASLLHFTDCCIQACRA